MSDLENQLATDLGVSSADTEQQAETQKVSDVPTDETEGVANQPEDQVDVAREIEARKEASRLATLQGQIKSYQSKLDSGKVTIDQVPEYLQKHLKFESILKEDDSDDIDTLVEKKLNERLAKQSDEQVYKSKLQEIKSSNLPNNDKTRLIEKWEFYKSKGFMDGEALAEAMELIGIKPVKTPSNPQNASLPKTASKKGREVYKLSELVKLPQKEYNAIRMKEKRGEIDIVD